MKESRREEKLTKEQEELSNEVVKVTYGIGDMLNGRLQSINFPKYLIF